MIVTASEDGNPIMPSRLASRIQHRRAARPKSLRLELLHTARQLRLDGPTLDEIAGEVYRLADCVGYRLLSRSYHPALAGGGTFMRATKAGWFRVTRAEPCKICCKPDWCLVSADGAAVICARIMSPNRRGEAGWLHRLDGRTAAPRFPTTPRPPLNDRPNRELADLADSYHAAAIARNLIPKLARQLGVAVQASRRCERAGRAATAVAGLSQ